MEMDEKMRGGGGRNKGWTERWGEVRNVAMGWMNQIDPRFLLNLTVIEI